MAARGILLLALLLLIPPVGRGAAAQKEKHQEVVGVMHILLNVGTEAYKQGDYRVAARCMRDVVRSENGKSPPPHVIGVSASDFWSNFCPGGLSVVHAAGARGLAR